ncbi:MAG: 3-coathanger stack domain-containing protein [Spirosomataceae bacterium]
MRKTLFVLLLSLSTFLAKSQVVLSGSSYSQNFDNLVNGLPAGWTVRTGSNATSLGTAASLTTATTAWSNTAGAFKNFASADGLTSTSTSTQQGASTDRALGVRQTGTFGDPNAAFVMQVSNTTGFENFTLAFKLQSLDAASARTVTWQVQWAVGANPTSFNTLTTVPATLTTGGSTFASTDVTATLPSGVNNQSENLWIRIVTLASSAGANNRPSTGIDDLSLTYSPINTSNPSIVTSTNSLSNFTVTEGSPSTEQSYTVSGENLTEAITVTAPNGFEVSLSPTSGYAGSLVLPQSSGVVATTTIYARLIGNTAGSFSGNITNASTGATQQNVSVAGTVNPPLTNFIPIATARAQTQGTTVTIAGRVTVGQQFGGFQIFIQDNTGGISVYRGTGNIVQENGLAIGDSVQVQGVLGNFNQLLQVNVSQISKVNTSSVVPAPKVISSSEILQNEGLLVRINDVNIQTTTFAAQTNYSFVPVQVRITQQANSAGYVNPLVGTSITAGTGYVTGIAGRFNTSSQVLARLTTDIVRTGDPAPGSTDDTFDADGTLDVACWNIEWFGATGSGFGPTDETLQKENAKTVIKTINADIFNLNEIANLTAFNTLVSELNTEGFAYTGVCSSRLSNNDNVSGQRVCFLYKTALFSNVTTRHIFEAIDDSLDASQTPNLLNSYPDADKTRFWASGRLPFTLTADVNIPNSPSKRIMFVGVHARANTSTNPTEALSRYNMRKFDVEALRDTLNARFANLPIIMLGDFNDDLDFTVATTAGVPNNETSYVAYNNDPTRFNMHTRALSDAGLKSTVSFSDMIDHVIASNELTSNYVAGSARVSNAENYLTSYGSTTSDHYSVMLRFNLTESSPCSTLVTLVSPADDYSSGTVTKQASSTAGKIVATNAVTGTANATYQAKAVELNAGFKAESGTIFKAEIGGCN